METELIKSEIVINWKQIVRAVFKRWWILLICLIVGAAAGFVASLTVKPSYSATLRYEIVGGNTTERHLTLVSILKTDSFSKGLSNEIRDNPEYQDLKAISYKQIKASLKISYNYKENGYIMYVKATNPNPKVVLAILQTFDSGSGDDRFFENYLYNDIQTNEGVTFNPLEDSTHLEPEMVSDSVRTRYTLMGGVGLAAVAALVLVVIELLDTRIKSSEDLSDKYGIPVLGNIPNFEDKTLTSGGYNYYAEKQ